MPPDLAAFCFGYFAVIPVIFKPAQVNWLAQLIETKDYYQLASYKARNSLIRLIQLIPPIV
jgi:hypothetical protein